MSPLPLPILPAKREVVVVVVCKEDKKKGGRNVWKRGGKGEREFIQRDCLLGWKRPFSLSFLSQSILFRPVHRSFIFFALSLRGKTNVFLSEKSRNQVLRQGKSNVFFFSKQGDSWTPSSSKRKPFMKMNKTKKHLYIFFFSLVYSFGSTFLFS